VSYYPFVLAIGFERVIELVVAQRNAKWSIARGGKEFGRDHYPAMVSMHALLLVSCLVEVVPWAGRSSVGWDGRWSPSSR
jgi:methyltransferase